MTKILILKKSNLSDVSKCLYEIDLKVMASSFQGIDLVLLRALMEICAERTKNYHRKLSEIQSHLHSDGITGCRKMDMHDNEIGQLQGAVLFHYHAIDKILNFVHYVITLI